MYIRKRPQFSPLNLGEVLHPLYLLIFPQLQINQYRVMRQNNISATKKIYK